ncbi:energy-coupling factor transport system permease protein [Pseudoclavibacter sp. JAI123]|uniref:energy-coupling factor transporter transmembrane component T family protein n=1 Tax=Pseudoclavibacter sp. JAI123 TaxID=2723065 RepID=UPI0015CB37B0|nr:energy-coupling factor transporter transmembrane component T [Pseudoclavibacter sp. JAI123]NYF14506.1 energy-coupling factor transport system permease protein [Pseudoclavibacter sp. JAI123]
MSGGIAPAGAQPARSVEVDSDGVPLEVLPVGGRFLDRVNPVTPFLAAVLYSIPLLTTLDIVSALAALVLAMVAFGVAGVRPVEILRSSWILLIAAPVSATSMLLYAKPGGESYGQFLYANITDNSIQLAIAVGVRVLAIGVPTLVALSRIDPTRLADGLAQVAHLPARFVVSALAGIRLFAVFRDDWTAMSQARRARGLGDSGAVPRLMTMAFALLALAIRRAGTLATVMEARGFGAEDVARTWARPSRLGWRDLLLVLAAVGIAAVAVAVSVALGSYRLVGSA